MDADPPAIPPEASEIISATWPSGARHTCHYELAGQIIGYRSWAEDGALELEHGLLDGQMHGPFFVFYPNGQLCEAAHYVHGREHGVTRQYDGDGTLVGSYRMEYGTGIDLWLERPGVVAEERWLVDGERHGYERWWNSDNQSVYEESHFQRGAEHGIFRAWNQAGRLRRGFPRYFVAGRQVIKRQYERACRADPTLPPFSSADNAPARQLPAEVRALLAAPVS